MIHNKILQTSALCFIETSAARQGNFFDHASRADSSQLLSFSSLSSYLMQQLVLGRLEDEFLQLRREVTLFPFCKKVDSISRLRVLLRRRFDLDAVYSSDSDVIDRKSLSSDSLS